MKKTIWQHFFHSFSFSLLNSTTYICWPVGMLDRNDHKSSYYSIWTSEWKSNGFLAFTSYQHKIKWNILDLAKICCKVLFIYLLQFLFFIFFCLILEVMNECDRQWAIAPDGVMLHQSLLESQTDALQ